MRGHSYQVGTRSTRPREDGLSRWPIRLGLFNLNPSPAEALGNLLQVIGRLRPLSISQFSRIADRIWRYWLPH